MTCLVNRRAALKGLAASALAGHAMAMSQPPKPLIIAHRGYSGLRPEHTLEGYMLAAEAGADVIEPDLVFTKDGYLICRHDRYLSTTTNVSDIAAFRSRLIVKPGRNEADWYAEDFTLDEIKSLKARQAFPGRSSAFDDQFDIPTFAELLAMAKTRGWRLYPEAKHPAIAAAHGHDFKAALAPFFDAAASGAIGPSFLQCFDPAFTASLPELKHITRVQLLFISPGASLDVKTIADGAEAIGPNKEALTPEFMDAAHTAGLLVHPWTFRSDALPGNLTAREEYHWAFDLGVDGVFSDFTGDALEARRVWLTQR